MAVSVLAACTGGNNGVQSSVENNGVIQLMELFDDDTCLARRLAKQFLAQAGWYNNVDWTRQQVTSPDRELCYFEASDEGSVYCYDLHDGRYAVLFERFDTYLSQFSYASYVLDNNLLMPCDTIFPKPGINDFYANATKFPKLAYKVLGRLIDENHFYQFDPEKSSMKVGFCKISDYPFVYFYQAGVSESKKPHYPRLEYTWTGKKFVLSDNPDYGAESPSIDRLTYDGFAEGSFARYCSDSSYLYLGDDPVMAASGDMGGCYDDDVAVAEDVRSGKQAKLLIYTRDEASGYHFVSSNHCVGSYRVTGISFLPEEILKVSVSDVSDRHPYAYYFKYTEGTDKGTLGLIGGEKDGKRIMFPEGTFFPMWTFNLGEDIFDYCDMQAVWEQIDKIDTDSEATPEFGPNCISYELGLYYMRQRFVKSFYMGDNAFKVVDLYNYERFYDDQIIAYDFHIAEYIFKDGKLTPTELQPELRRFSGKHEVSFLCDTIEADMQLDGEDYTSRERAYFRWNPDDKKFDLLIHLNPRKNDDSDNDSGWEDKLENVSQFINQMSEFNGVKSAKGDLNGDGVPDYVIAVDGSEGEDGSIAIYFGYERGFGNISAGGMLKAVCRKMKDLNNLSITDKGVVRIETVYEGESTTTLVYMIRYQDGGFFLIGGKDDMDGNATSYNFLTGKKVVGKQSFDLPDTPLIEFSHLKIGYFERGGEIFQESK